MVITDSYLGNRFNGRQIATDAYDNFLKKKNSAAPSTGSAPVTKRQQKKAVKTQKKELRKQGLAPKKPILFAKKKAAATGINSPAAKRTGLFGIKQKPNPDLANLGNPEVPELNNTTPQVSDTPVDSNEPEATIPNNQADNLADGASNDLNGISDKTPAANAESTSGGDTAGTGEQAPEGLNEEDQFFAYDLEQWRRRQGRQNSSSYYSFDEPAADKKVVDKKKSISVAAVLGLLGAAVAGAIAMYVVVSAGEKTTSQRVDLPRYH